MESVKVISLFCERISHSMRTPLGVSLGVLEDLSQGYEVEPEDIRDAVAALKRITSILDGLKIAAREFQSESKETSLMALVQRNQDRLKESFAGRGLNIVFPKSLLCADQGFSKLMDEEYILRAIELALGYIVGKTSETANVSSELEPVILEICAIDGGKEILRLTTPSLEDVTLIKKLPQNSTWKELAKLDRVESALGLLFASELIHSCGGETECGLISKQKLLLSAVI